MTPIADEPAPPCAAWAKEAMVDPIGTAGSAAGFLLVEWPRPWPRDAADVPELAGLGPGLRSDRIRLQLVEPADRPASRHHLRLVLHRHPDHGWFDGYRANETTADAADVVAAAERLLRGEGTPVGDRADVLICSHGTRDTCCGSLGTRLALDLRDTLPASFRLWRTSHLGGHRFAPTMVVLPDGTSWAHVTADDVRNILERRGPLDGLLRRYRGSTVLSTPEIQALERAAFAAGGWSWLDGARRELTTDGSRAGLVWRSIDGRIRRWEGVVVPGRPLPVPPCRAPLSSAAKTEPELVLAAFRYADDVSSRPD